MVLVGHGGEAQATVFSANSSTADTWDDSVGCPALLVEPPAQPHSLQTSASPGEWPQRCVCVCVCVGVCAYVHVQEQYIRMYH